MTLSYFDSSVVLTILLEEDRKYEAYEYWQNSKMKVSSILLKIETIVTLKCRTLDAVHIATALKFREINDNKDVTIYTYDRMMIN
jgi:hypothetical protein